MHLQDVVNHLPNLGGKSACLKRARRDKLIEQGHYIDQQGQYLPEIFSWKWGDTRECG